MGKYEKFVVCTDRRHGIGLRLYLFAGLYCSKEPACDNLVQRQPGKH
jgi:hypothetical protein